jgi:hypothetical protein
MRFRKREPLLSVLLGTGLHLLDSLRERLPDDVDDFKNRVRDTYNTASQRVDALQAHFVARRPHSCWVKRLHY